MAVIRRIWCFFRTGHRCTVEAFVAAPGGPLIRRKCAYCNFATTQRYLVRIP